MVKKIGCSVFLPLLTIAKSGVLKNAAFRIYTKKGRPTTMLGLPFLMRRDRGGAKLFSKTRPI